MNGLKVEKIPSRLKEYVQKIRLELRNNNDINQKELDFISCQIEPYKNVFLPGEKDELLNWVNSSGISTEIKGPRWLFHLLGIRHKCAHILLYLNSPALLEVLLLQVRSWSKFDQPGCLDVTVSGHVQEGLTAEESAYIEMQEEIGLKKQHLKNSCLTWKFSYENFSPSPEINFFNLEWREVYTAEVDLSILDKIRFNDFEVVGISLFPLSQSKNILNQTTLQLASGLKNTLPKFLSRKIS